MPMNEEKFYEMLTKVRDLSSGIADSINDYLVACNATVHHEYDVAKIKWEPRTSSKDQKPFETATAANNQGNKDFESLQNHLKQHDRGIQIGKGEAGLYYWIMTGGADIGRKKTSFPKR